MSGQQTDANSSLHNSVKEDEHTVNTTPATTISASNTGHDPKDQQIAELQRTVVTLRTVISIKNSQINDLKIRPERSLPTDDDQDTFALKKLRMNTSTETSIPSVEELQRKLEVKEKELVEEREKSLQLARRSEELASRTIPMAGENKLRLSIVNLSKMKPMNVLWSYSALISDAQWKFHVIRNKNYDGEHFGLFVKCISGPPYIDSWKLSTTIDIKLFPWGVVIPKLEHSFTSTFTEAGNTWGRTALCGWENLVKWVHEKRYDQYRSVAQGVPNADLLITIRIFIARMVTVRTKPCNYLYIFFDYYNLLPITSSWKICT